MHGIVEQAGATTSGARARDNGLMTRAMTWIAGLVAVCSAACSQALDWREFVPEGSGLSVTFPCRPDRHVRTVALSGTRTQMDMLVCAAGDATFALSFVDVADPARVSATLAELRATAVSNVQGRDPHLIALRISGMTPNEQARRVSVTGRLPDGAAVQEHAAFFVHGLRVYQATVIGANPAAQAVETFFAGLRFPA